MADKKGVSTLTKKRFFLIEERLKGIIKNDEDLKETMDVIKDVMKFDPSVPLYTPELGQKMKEYRHKVKEETGLSTYIINGGKKCYERKKEREKTI